MVWSKSYVGKASAGLVGLAKPPYFRCFLAVSRIELLLHDAKGLAERDKKLISDCPS